MRVTCALLCDAATVREGLLHVLGGGVTRIWRTEVPTALGVDLALLLSMDQAEQDEPHNVRAVLYGPDVTSIMEVGGVVQYNGGARLEPNEEHSIAMAFPFRDAVVNTYGRHVIDLTVDDESHRRVDVWVLHPEEMSLPPLE